MKKENKPFNDVTDYLGDYYLLKNRSLQKINNAVPKTVSSGFTLQVIGSERPEKFSTDIGTTKFVFIDSYIE